MPTAPRRPCSGSPTCKALVARGLCASCKKKREQHRGTRHERGYDAAWVDLRNAFLAVPKNRACVRCAARRRLVPATEVDHIVPFDGLHDPLRLDPTNLQALCGTCHRQKTADQQRVLPATDTASSPVIWNGEMDRDGSCPSLVDGQVSRPSTLPPSVRERE